MTIQQQEIVIWMSLCYLQCGDTLSIEAPQTRTTRDRQSLHCPLTHLVNYQPFDSSITWNIWEQYGYGCTYI